MILIITDPSGRAQPSDLALTDPRGAHRPSDRPPSPPAALAISLRDQHDRDSASRTPPPENVRVAYRHVSSPSPRRDKVKFNKKNKKLL